MSGSANPASASVYDNVKVRHFIMVTIGHNGDYHSKRYGAYHGDYYDDYHDDDHIPPLHPPLSMIMSR